MYVHPHENRRFVNERIATYCWVKKGMRWQAAQAVYPWKDDRRDTKREKRKQLRHPGSEPGASRWQRDILPLNQWRLDNQTLTTVLHKTIIPTRTHKTTNSKTTCIHVAFLLSCLFPHIP